MRKQLTLLTICLILLGATLIARNLMFGGASYVSLTNDPIGIATSKALESSSKPNYIPVEGKDFTISHVQYFYNQTWAVVNTQSVGSSSDPGTLIMEKINSVYQKVLGPDNSFQGVDFGGIPDQVVNYIKS